MKKILIYNDSGANAFCVSSILAALELEGPNRHQYTVCYADRHLLKERAWQKETDLLIFPGGRDIPYHRALQGAANDHIREFVLGGGHYFGICAGSYYACAAIEFEKDNALEVLAQRELKFFPGIARGPAYGSGKFCYQSHEGAQIASLSLCPSLAIASTSAAYYNGGCTFVAAENYKNVHILGRYADIEDQPPAIIQCSVGAGKALLCGVHPESSALHPLAKEILPDKHFSALLAIEQQRRQLFGALLNLSLQ